MAATDEDPSRADIGDVEPQPIGPVEGASETRDDAPVPRDATPSVTAVVVAHEPGEWFTETLDSLLTQDYPRLGILVVDAAGDPDLPALVESVAPSANIVDASDTVGFGAAANTVLETGIEPAFLLICHDDIALAPDAVRHLVTEALRSNAGITGPKLVDWDDPDRLQHVGLVVDRFAGAAEVVEPDELDQEQYDAVADVFALPSACMLVRTSLFATIGGFDPAMTRRGEDVDLCWRAQLAGARVLVVPDALARHREEMVERTGVDDIRRTRARHQLRTVLVCGSWLSLLITLPALALMTIGEAGVALLTGRVSQVSDVVGAWGWNLRRLPEVMRRRKETGDVKRARHADIRALQQTGSVRINAFVRGQIGRGEGRLGREIVSAIRTGTTRFALITWAIVALVVLFGSRALISSGIPAVGDFAEFPESAGALVDDWWSGWRDRDLGAPGTVPSGYGLLGVVAAVLAGSIGFVRTAWVLGPVIVGLIGAWRMLGVTGSRRAQIGALIAYTIVPLPWVSIASASISGLMAYALSPWVLLGLFRAQASAPYRTASGPVRNLPRNMLGLGVVIGGAVIFEPSLIVLVPLVAAGLLAGSLIAINPSGFGRMILVVAGGVVVAAVVALPQTLDALAGGPTWEMLSEGHSSRASTLGLGDILRFAVGPGEASGLVAGFAIPMITPLLIGRAWRFDLAVRLWSVALSSWGLVFAAASGWLPVALPDAAALLGPAAAAVAGLAGAAILSIEHDLRTAGFGWRQALLPAAVAGAVLAGLPTVGAMESGRWGLGRGDFETSLPFVDPAVDGSYRVIWMGDPSFLPANGRDMAPGLAWTASLDGLPTISERHLTADPGSAELIEDVFAAVIDRETSRAGRLLGGLGVRYVVVLERLAPAPFSDPDDARPAPGVLIEALAGQLDLRQLSGVNSAIRVYENTEWTSVRAAAVSGFDDGVEDLFDLAVQPVSGTLGVLTGTGDSISGVVPEGTEVLVAQTPDPGWSLQVGGGEASRRRALGWTSAYIPSSGGEATLEYATPAWRRFALVAQLVVLVALCSGWLRGRLSGRSH